MKYCGFIRYNINRAIIIKTNGHKEFLFPVVIKRSKCLYLENNISNTSKIKIIVVFDIYYNYYYNYYKYYKYNTTLNL